MSTPDGYAEPDEVHARVTQMTQAEYVFFIAVAQNFIQGTGYSDPEEMVQDALLGALFASQGEGGRRWPVHVLFKAYMVKTIQRLAQDARRGVRRSARRTVTWNDAEHGAIAEQPDAADELDEEQESQGRSEQAAEDLAALIGHFRDDPEVQWIIDGERDGLSAAEVRGRFTTQTDYDTARKRLRRAKQKLFPERAKAAHQRSRRGLAQQRARRK
jgi:DNA-directed RNA polymerase specialized sigma24 family protein